MGETADWCLVPIPVSFQFRFRPLTNRFDRFSYGTMSNKTCLSMLRFIRKSVLVQRESWRVLHGLRQSSDAVEMEASNLRVLYLLCPFMKVIPYFTTVTRTTAIHN